MIVLDAGVLIAFLDPADEFHESAVGFFERHASAPLAMSVLTVAESLVRPTLAGVAASAERVLDELEIREVGMMPGAGRMLAGVRAETRLRMPDAVVLFTAEQERAGLATTDASLARAALARGVTTHRL